jgi:hypothetical protein
MFWANHLRPNYFGDMSADVKKLKHECKLSRDHFFMSALVVEDSKELIEKADQLLRTDALITPRQWPG